MGGINRGLSNLVERICRHISPQAHPDENLSESFFNNIGSYHQLLPAISSGALVIFANQRQINDVQIRIELQLIFPG